ncbi:MAG: hypothetical protein ACRENK_08385 [Gemmatimonadaceae bacterium]
MKRKRQKAPSVTGVAAPNNLPRTRGAAIRPRPKRRMTASEPAHILAMYAARIEGKHPDIVKASLALDPILDSAGTVQKFNGGGDLNIAALVFELEQQVRAVGAGKLERAEAMLVSHAHVLGTIFSTLARRAATNANQLNACETYLRLALRAQSQCRTTLETLALIKNPASVTFMRQANIGQAVQVNNGPRFDTNCGSRTREEKKVANELLGSKDGQQLD